MITAILDVLLIYTFGTIIYVLFMDFAEEHFIPPIKKIKEFIIMRMR